MPCFLQSLVKLQGAEPRSWTLDSCYWSTLLGDFSFHEVIFYGEFKMAFVDRDELCKSWDKNGKSEL